tara:strand:+ start:399 stop:773 length:375 start_codon:yes stop_codon:yes gene_type:complete
MTAPNIVGLNTLTGITTTFALTTLPEVIITNAADSNQVYKVNSILVSNKDGTNASDLNIKFHPHAAAGAGTSISLMHTVSVAADSTLVAVDRAAAFYVEEGQSVVAYAGAASDLDLLASYEIIE